MFLFKMKLQYFLSQVLLLNHLIMALCTKEKHRPKSINLDRLKTGHDYEFEESKELNNKIIDKFPMIKGTVWPTLRVCETKKEEFYEISSNVKLYYRCKPNKLLENVRKRFSNQLRTLKAYSNKSSDCYSHSNYAGKVKAVIITIDDNRRQVPHYDMIEKFSIKIEEGITIRAPQVWGVIRAMDTLLQLCYINEDGMLAINKNTIEDAPKYRHRGLMIDTESHYISVNNILKMLDAMAMNKMNVLHWRIVGETSFPYESKAFPRLSNNAAFHRYMVYNETSIKAIIDFATIRGIRVIPEFNIPGFLKTIVKSYPEIITRYITDSSQLGIRSSLESNPLINSTFEILNKLLQEMEELFPDDHIHVGGVDVNKDFWDFLKDFGRNRLRLNQGNSRKPVNSLKSKVVLYWGKSRISMKQARVERKLETQDLKDLKRVSSPNFAENLRTLFPDINLQFVKHLVFEMLRPQKILIVPQDALNIDLEDNFFPNNTKTQAYRENLFKKMNNCHKYKTLLSWPFDLTNRNNMSLAYFYEKIHSITVACDYIGGEALIYTNEVDDTNIFEWVWPRTCVVADILWHGMDEANDFRDLKILKSIHEKIQEQSRRMAMFGIPVSPVYPGFVEVIDEF